jgi:hypothetical protein
MAGPRATILATLILAFSTGAGENALGSEVGWDNAARTKQRWIALSAGRRGEASLTVTGGHFIR